MPQAIERSLATPMTRPRLPAIIFGTWGSSTAREGVDEDVEPAVGGLPTLEDPADLLVRLDVARLDEGSADAVGERPDPSLDEALHRGETDGRTRVVERLGDAPGDRVVVGHPEDEGVPTVEHAHPEASFRGQDTVGECRRGGFR